MFTELSLGCWSSGHRNLSMYQVSSSAVFFFVSYMHNTCPLYNVLLEDVCCCFPTFFLTCLCSSGHRASSLYQVSCLSVLCVSEIRELKEKKKKEKEKNSEIDHFQFNTFPGHIIYPFFNQRYLLSTCTDSIC